MFDTFQFRFLAHRRGCRRSASDLNARSFKVLGGKPRAAKWALAVAALLALWAHADPATPDLTEPYSQPAEGFPVAPNWILPDAEGTPVSLYNAVEQGQTVVMFFWATWCKQCKKLMPILRELDERKGDKPVAIYLMNLWENGDASSFLAQHKMTMPALNQTETVAQRYEIRITPGLVVVGPDKRIRYVRQAHERVADISERLQTLLGIALPEMPAEAFDEAL